MLFLLDLCENDVLWRTRYNKGAVNNNNRGWTALRQQKCSWHSLSEGQICSRLPPWGQTISCSLFLCGHTTHHISYTYWFQPTPLVVIIVDNLLTEIGSALEHSECVSGLNGSSLTDQWPSRQFWNVQNCRHASWQKLMSGSARNVNQ